MYHLYSFHPMGLFRYKLKVWWRGTIQFLFQISGSLLGGLTVSSPLVSSSVSLPYSCIPALLLYPFPTSVFFPTTVSLPYSCISSPLLLFCHNPVSLPFARVPALLFISLLYSCIPALHMHALHRYPCPTPVSLPYSCILALLLAAPPYPLP